MGNLIDSQMSYTVSDLISNATKRNWNKLSISSDKKELSSGANKRFSKKTIIPKENFDTSNNIQQVQILIEKIKASAYDIDDVLFSLGVNLLKSRKAITENIDNLRNEYKLLEIDEFIKYKLPDETDILGIVYQCIQTEGEKNIKGSYYTPKQVALNMVVDVKLKETDKVFDPCCGSSMFLTNIPNINPEQIFGVDIDPIAVLVSKFNFYAKFPDTKITPKIYRADFIAAPSLLDIRTDDFQQTILDNTFDYIITNPPWGGVSGDVLMSPYSKIIQSGEVFSYFLIKSFDYLNDNGILRFLLPCSILNVRLHKDIREFLIEKTNLTEIKLHPGAFAGVMTQYISIETKKEQEISDKITVIDEKDKYKIDKKTIKGNSNYIISAINDTDKQIIDIVNKKKKYTLENSIWALGIVTGDNKNKLKAKHQVCYEPIYTGKEITPFCLKKATKYVMYDRKNFQQVAKDEIYRAESKLVYKFISKKLVFSIDNSGSLFLNSANILIPNIPNMSIYSVAAFLNSELYQYLYMKMFGEIKILKGSLSQLPFAEITSEQDKRLSAEVSKIVENNLGNYSSLQDYIYNIFEITQNQIDHIKEVLYGNTN
ncbi:MAG: N-6 DNA methylase [Endomicrobium sp.]|jgi:type I restriction-modification system DNA methylase subunit|nr:N-6 DNA methylase [Endomicrobium sp.]